MQSFYRNATLGRLILFCLLTTTCLSILSAQDTTALRMHEVGLQISNFNLENFGLVYKVQRLGKENRYTRYRFVFGNLSFASIDQGSGEDYDISIGSTVGFERRANLGAKVQFIHGPELFASFRYGKSDRQNFDRQTVDASLGLGYILGLQYNFNNQFYINLEAVPDIAVNYLSSKIKAPNSLGEIEEMENTKFGINSYASSDNVRLTFAYRFGVARK